jgi:hypothetical protein
MAWLIAIRHFLNLQYLYFVLISNTKHVITIIIIIIIIINANSKYKST